MLSFKIITICLIICWISVTVNARKGFGIGSQEYGYVEVREGAHMFYWLYYKNTEQESKAPESPLVIWLQGGPGASSSYGNFEEIGTLHTNLKKRTSAWTKHVNVLFIDNPVGVGFSYVDDSNLLVKNNQEIARDLVTFTKKFYEKYKKFENTPLYVFSESYGGKMAIEFVYELEKEISMKQIKANLNGVVLGDAWISPYYSCYSWLLYLYFTSELGKYESKPIFDALDSLKKEIEKEHWLNATMLWGELEDLIENATYNINFYNTQYDRRIKNGESLDLKQNKKPSRGLKAYGNEKNLQVLMNGKVKRALQIPDHVNWSDISEEVFDALAEDFMKPVDKIVEKVLNETNIKVTVYNGQLDLIVNSLGTEIWIYFLKWHGAHGFQLSQRKPLTVDNKIEGFIINVDNFALYLINHAGHMVPKDNPKGALKMLKQITKLH